MARILVTGGTVFVSRAVAEYFAKQHDVTVLNRGSRGQPDGVHHLCADRHALGTTLHGQRFDALIDVCAYDDRDVNDLLNAFDEPPAEIVFISSSAVYPETAPQPFREEGPAGENRIWGSYGMGKLRAEAALHRRRPDAYILRPPYLYGPGQNVYREGFVFDCALQDRPFFLPGAGDMPLHFFHVDDLCRVIEQVLLQHPADCILNVGNAETVSIRTFAEMCYRAAGKEARFIEVHDHPNQRDYFPFHNYAYQLEVSRCRRLLPVTVPLETGLAESFGWYIRHPEAVNRRPYINFIDRYLMAEKRECRPDC